MSLLKNLKIIQGREMKQLNTNIFIPAGKKIVQFEGIKTRIPDKYSIQITNHLHLDIKGKPYAYLNHSCTPNTFIDTIGLGLIALKDIAANTELTINYCATEFDMACWFDCICGEKNCYGQVKGFNYLNQKQQKGLLPYLSRHLKEKLYAQRAQNR